MRKGGFRGEEATVLRVGNTRDTKEIDIVIIMMMGERLVIASGSI